MTSNTFTDIKAMRDIEGYSHQAVLYTRLREKKSQRKTIWRTK
jgi:hypothetical protein